MNDNSMRILEVDINEVLPNRFQPRIQFDESEILELSDSIKEHGVIQPLVVRAVGDKYEIISGERRYKASVLAGKETVPVIVKNLNDKDSAEIALIENVQRKNLTPIEEALSYKKILDIGYITQESLAEKIGKSQSSIANKIRLLNLSDEVQEALLENKISERHARSLLKLSNNSDQNKMLEKIIKERLTVRRTDEEISKMILSEDNDDEGNNGSKILERKEGEKNMNNNYSQNPQSMPSFDMFGGTPDQPIMNGTQSMPSFDMFGGSAPAQPAMESPQQTPGFDMFGGSAPAQPTMESPQQTPGFDMFGGSTPAQPTMESPQQTPGFDMFGGSTPAQPAMESPQQTSSFDMFGGSAPAQPAMESPQQTPSFDMFGGSAPAQPAMESPQQTPGFDMFGGSAPAQPAMDSPQPTSSFDMFGGSAPAQPAMEAPQQTPGFDMFGGSAPAQPAMESPQQTPGFDMFGGSAPAQPTMESPQPTSSFDMNVGKNQGVPFTAPIQENDTTVQQDTNIPQMSDSPVNTNFEQSISNFDSQFSPETTAQEPIIITDYSKQYDPVMPTAAENSVSKADFKEVINAIRECSNKIEQFGYKIDLEEYDLNNMYQVVFKVEK